MRFERADKIAGKAISNPVKFIISGLLVLLSILAGHDVFQSSKLSDCINSKDSFLNKQNDILQSRIDKMLDQKLQTAGKQIEVKQSIIQDKTDSVNKRTDSIVNVLNKITQ